MWFSLDFVLFLKIKKNTNEANQFTLFIILNNVIFHKLSVDLKGKNTNALGK
jgi:hypothetical protein